MSKKYLVKLTPHDKFFFGGENTFGEGASKNYFVKSNYYPQQTTLLGLIRYQLLAQNGLLKNNKISNETEAEKLIGPESFKLNNGFSIGVVKSLSPVFLSNSKGEYLFPSNREYQYTDKNKDKINTTILDFYQLNGTTNITENFIPYLDKYDPKLELPELLIQNKSNEIYKHEEIFIAHKQTGIRKNYKGVTEDNAYYIQVFYKLKDYSFAFIVEIDDDKNLASQPLVVLGAEQSKFRMDVAQTEIEFDNLVPDYEKSTNSPKVILVSDTYLSNEIFNHCDFAITDTVDFRSMISSVKSTKNYAKLGGAGLNIDDKYNFFKRGSVFYGNTDKITEFIVKDNDSLKKLGYNHYKKVDKQGT